MENYLEQLSCVTEWGGMNEIEAMSRLYKHDFIIFYGQKMMKTNVTNNGYDKFIYLCHTSLRQYEAVYEKNIIANSAFCQSIVYQTLFKNVFQMSAIDETVQQMLHEHSINIKHNDKYSKNNNNNNNDKIASTEHSNKSLEFNGDEIDDITKIAPIPYRIAKALDPNIYRNTDFDIWHEIKREVRNASWMRWNNTELQIGGKCLVQMDYKNFIETNNNLQNIMDEQDKNGNLAQSNIVQSGKKETLIGHIQEMSKNEGPVVVFIEELGEKKTVPFTALKSLPPTRKPKCPISGPNSPRKNISYDQCT